MTTTTVRPATRSTGEVFDALRPTSAARSCEHTTLDLPVIGNSVLADKLAAWDEEQCFGIMGEPDQDEPVGPFRRTRTLVGWASSTGPTRTQQLRFVALATAAVAVLPLTPASVRWTATAGELITASTVVPAAGDDDGPTGAGEDLTASPGQARANGDAVAAVKWMAAVTGLPDRDVLAGAGIAQRTWHHWRSSGAKPRVGSQGQLWVLLLSVESLAAGHGEDLASWFSAQTPRRRELLRDGQHEALVTESMREAIRAGAFDDPAAQARNARRSAGFYDEAAAGS